jgi:hypothetical protein
VTATIEANLDPFVNQPFALHAISDLHFRQQINRALLHQARGNAGAKAFGSAALQDDRLDSLHAEQACKQQARRLTAPDPDSCAHEDFAFGDGKGTGTVRS